MKHDKRTNVESEKVPVKCSNCGKLKYNVVYKEEKQVEEKAVEKKEPEIKVENLPPQRPKTHYIADIVANQKRLAQMYDYSEEE